jgi:hypothetical protein
LGLLVSSFQCAAIPSLIQDTEAVVPTDAAVPSAGDGGAGSNGRGVSPEAVKASDLVAGVKPYVRRDEGRGGAGWAGRRHGEGRGRATQAR